MSEYVYSPNTYAGEAYADKVFPALLRPKGLIDRGLITPRPGIKKRQVLRTIDDNIEFQNPSCSFNAQTGDIDVAERYLDPVKYEVMKEICFDDLRTSWDAMKLKAGSLNDYVPPADEESALIEHWNMKIGIMNEQLYIFGKNGVTSGAVTFSADYPGLIERLRDDSTVNKYETGDIGVADPTKMSLSGITSANPGVVTVSSTADLRTGDKITLVNTDGNQQVGGVSIEGKEFTITVLSSTTFSLGVTVTGVTAATQGDVVFVNVSNVLEFVTFVYQNIPEAVRTYMDLKILAPLHITRALHIAGGNGINTMNGNFLFKINDQEQLTIEGMPYWPANTVAVYAVSNLFLGFDAESDEVELKIVDLSKTIGDKKYRYFNSMKTDVNHLYGNEIMLIAPITESTES
jgi:hypothetical protein